MALHCTFYNFVRIHKTLRVTPAMAAGLADRLWDVRDIVALVEATEVAEGPKKRGPTSRANKPSVDRKSNARSVIH